ncbi:type II secretion system F family protein [Rhodococcus opacus]|uniref:type II secretion system F family protein n=1 Tax=Rhodococcus opacus TaxID=37919 RepID=UPI0029C47F7F|nr:type II secretion system F family protein [Rhodococcus opacus]MDX5961766.1 type II secretion system F family protein [Rhodococcus opacus]
MYSLLAVALSLALIAGLALIYQGWDDRRNPTAPQKRRRARRVDQKTRVLLFLGLIAGAVAWLVTGWFLAVVLLPAAFAGLPKLLGKPPAESEIARLNAMEEWVRNLSGVLSAGAGIEQAIIATHRSIPAALDSEISHLIQRLRSNTPINDALRRYAAELDDATGDLIAGALIQAAALRGSGLAAALERLARSVAEDVRNRRAVEASRKGARTTARWVTIIALVFITGLFVLTDFMNFYKTAGGQLLFLGFMTAFALVLWWMKILTRPIKLPRFIGKPAHLDTSVPVAEGAHA